MRWVSGQQAEEQDKTKIRHTKHPKRTGKKKNFQKMGITHKNEKSRLNRTKQQQKRKKKQKRNRKLGGGGGGGQVLGKKKVTEM